MERDITSIQDLIDLNILDFLKYASKLDFSFANNLTKMLDMELSRVRLLRDNIYSSMDLEAISNLEYDTLSRNFVSTYIQEQKILDRQGIIQEKVKKSGVRL